MSRPRLCRRVCFEPNVTYFKPAGIRIIDLEELNLTVDEFEAVRLKDLLGLEQEEAAKKMDISQPTFHRLISSARKKIADALINGKALKIEGGPYKMAELSERKFKCFACSHGWVVPHGLPRPATCPKCGDTNIHRHPSDRGPHRRRCGRR